MKVEKPATPFPNAAKPATAIHKVGVNVSFNTPDQFANKARIRREHYGGEHSRYLCEGSASTPKMTSKCFPASPEATSNRSKVVLGSKVHNIQARESFTHRQSESRIIDNLTLMLSWMQV